MFKYRKVESAQEKHADNEVRVSNAKTVRAYLTYIHGLFDEKKFDTVILRGTGFVIHKCLSVADLVRRRIKDLHEIVEFGTLEITDTYEPLEEGLDTVTLKRKIPFITIKLSQKPLDKNHPGYHEPLPADQVTPFTPFVAGTGERRGGRRGRGARRGFRGGRGGRFGGRRGFRGGRRRGGYSRGGYSNENYGYDYQEGGYEQPRRARGGRRAARRPFRAGRRGGRRGGYQENY